MNAQNVSVPDLVQVAIQFGLPLLVGLVTKSSTPSKYKALLLVALTGANTALLGYTGPSDLASLGLTALLGIVVSIGAHKGVFEPTGLTDLTQRLLIKDSEPEVVEEPVLEPEPEEPLCPIKHKVGSAASAKCTGRHA